MPPSEVSDSLSVWRAEQARFSGFGANVSGTDWHKLFARITGRNPSRQSQQFEQEAVTFELVEGECTMVLQVTPERVDFVRIRDLRALTAQFNPDVKGDSVEQIEAVAEAGNIISEVLGGFTRIALGSVNFWPRDSSVDAYEKLQILLPHLEVDVGNSSDLIYRINRPRIELIDGTPLKINRLSTWSSVLIQLGVISSEGGTMRHVGHAVRVELDINTHVDTPVTGLTVLQQRSLIETLGRYSREILASGDLR